MDKIYFPKSQAEIISVFEEYKIPEDYFSPNIEIISYNHNPYLKQKFIHIKYKKRAKTLLGSFESKIYMIERGLEDEYNVESPKPQSEFLYYIKPFEEFIF